MFFVLFFLSSLRGMSVFGRIRRVATRPTPLWLAIVSAGVLVLVCAVAILNLFHVQVVHPSKLCFANGLCINAAGDVMSLTPASLTIGMGGVVNLGEVNAISLAARGSASAAVVSAPTLIADALTTKQLTVRPATGGDTTAGATLTVIAPSEDTAPANLAISLTAPTGTATRSFTTGATSWVHAGD